MSNPNEPEKKPPPQPTIEWDPDDTGGSASQSGPQQSGDAVTSSSQPTVEWDPEDVRGSAARSVPHDGEDGPSPASQPTVAWDPQREAETLPPSNQEPTTPPHEDPLVGKLLRDKWRVLERLGAGSFGTVYKVQDVKGGWIEALKILGVGRLTGAEADNMRARFLREAQIMKRLGTESPHIVGLGTYEEDLEAGLIYFLMEFVEGRSLSDVLFHEGPLNADRVIRLALQVCDALIAAHDGPEPVVHRDLKLENLMLTSDRGGEETVKVLDFGIAKIAEREPDSRLTTVGTLGTPGYAAPEQLRAEEVDGRTDLFAFGVILYSLLTGRDPWLGHPAHESTNQIYELMAATDRGEVRSFEEAGYGVPPALATVVLRLMRREPSERYQSARELRDALERIAAGGADSQAGSLRILTATPGARVEVRFGRQTIAKGTTPCVANGVSPGTYKVILVDPRFEPIETSVTLGAGAMEDLMLVPRPRRKGVGAAARRRPGVPLAGLAIIVLLAGVYQLQPLGREVAPAQLREMISNGSVGAAWLVDGGVDGLVRYGPITTPFHLPVDESDIPRAVGELRSLGVDIDTYYEVQRLTQLARDAQSRSRYYGLDGGDVRSYALRLAEIDPDSEDARSLLLKVGERMAWDAEEAIAEGSDDAATELVDQCLALVEGHPRCTALREGL